MILFGYILGLPFKRIDDDDGEGSVKCLEIKDDRDEVDKYG
jgi:hypothetical protein